MLKIELAFRAYFFTLLGAQSDQNGSLFWLKWEPFVVKNRIFLKSPNIEQTLALRMQNKGSAPLKNDIKEEN